MRDTCKALIAVAATLTAGLVLCQPGRSLAQETTAGYDNGNSATNSVNSSSYDRGRNVGVRERERSDYQAIGLHLGGFMVFPKVSASEAYDDNIFAVKQSTIGDFITTVAPEVDFQSTWSRDSLSGYVKAQQDWYASHSTENGAQFGGGLAGKVDFGQSTLTAGVDSGRYLLPRSVTNNIGASKSRIPYVYTASNVQLAHEFTRLRVAARVDYQIYDYSNGATPAGLVVFEKDQDRKVLTYTGKAEFALSPDTSIYVTGAGNDRRYDLNPPSVAFTRDSSGYDVDVGASFDLTHLVRGEVQVGYLNQTYKSPLFKTISGPSALVQLEWFPSPLTTVTVQARRAVGDSGVIGSAGFLATNGSLQVDHELLRNLIVTANAWTGYDEYNGVDRKDDLLGAGLSANWLLTHSAGLTFAYTFADQRSTGAAKGASFNDNRISITAILQY
jgi:hypothetical protein